MSPPNIYYSAILMTAGVACLVVAVMVWYARRGDTGAYSLVVFLLALSWWDITYAIFWIGFPGLTPYFWLDATLTGAFVVPTSFLIFSLEYSRLQKWLTRPVLFALMIEPLLVFIIQWTDPWHDLYFGGKRALNTTMILDAGPVSWANVYYSYILILISIVILGVTYYRSVGIYRNQAAMILAAIIIPWVVHIGYMSTGGLLPNADVTPFIFSTTALVLAFALVRYRLLDIMPIAHSVLIENMSEGVIVLDTLGRVVDINPAAQRVTQLSVKLSLGAPVEQVFVKWSEIVAMFQEVNQARVEVQVGETCLDFRVSPLKDNHNLLVGRLIVWRDITDLKNTQAKLEKLATTDALTQIFNRRYFFEKAETELKRMMRQNRALSVALLDIDHFKSINDTYGHPAGDIVLIAFAKICQLNIRDFDVLARFGGEEFALLMPETDLEQAHQVGERLRAVISESLIELGVKSIHLTASLGIAELTDKQDSLENLLHRADQSLYAAKESGRNRVVLWSESLNK